MKKVSIYFSVFFIIIGILLSSATLAGAAVSDSGYTGLDLSLTETVFDKIGQNGKVIAAVVNSKSVNMYKSPYYSTYDRTSEKHYAVKIDSETNEYLRDAGKEKVNQTRPQRTILTSGLTYSVDNTNVISLNADGSFKTVGYGLAVVTVSYDAGTPETISDDVTNSVAIICSDDHRMSVGEEKWSDSEGSYLRLHEKIDGVWQNDGGDYLWGKNASSGKGYQNFRLNWDPMGDSDGDLVIEAIGSERANVLPATTFAAREGGYIKNNSIIMHTWFYDSMTYNPSGSSVKVLSFGYSGTGANAQKSYLIGSLLGSVGAKQNTYNLWGGDYSIRTYSPDNSYIKKGATKDGKIADNSPSGVRNVATRTKGWHQFVVTAEPSLVHPGTDYLLTKVYVDGKLITAQDIYVGDIPVSDRQCNISVYSSKDTANAVESTTPAFAQDKYFCYKDLCVKGFKKSSTITDSFPLDGAKNVPLYNHVKIKLGEAATSVLALNIEALEENTPVSFNATLDETKTVVTIDLGRLNANKTYTVSAAGEAISFTTGADNEFADIVEDMATLGYVMNSSRYIDFIDNSKHMEEYGLGFCYLLPGLSGKVDNGVLSIFEKERNIEFTAASYNSLILRNLSPHVKATDSADEKVDRVVVSYKAKFETGYSTTNNGSSGAISVPIIGQEYLSDKYNPHIRSLVRDSTIPNLYGAKEDKIEVDPETGEETLVKGGYSVQMSLLKSSTSTSAYSVNGTHAPNSRFSFGYSNGMILDNYLDEDGYIRITYVIDVDDNGKVKLNFVAGENLHDLGKNFEYSRNTAFSPTAYVDALYFSLTLPHKTNTVDKVLKLKEIQIYNFDKKVKYEVGDTITVKNSTTGATVYANELKNVTVDAYITAKGSGEYKAAFVVLDSTNNKFETVKIVSGNFSEQETKIQAEKIAIPDKENLKLMVYVWNSLEEAEIIREGITYDAMQQ